MEHKKTATNKAEETDQPAKPKKPPGYRKFEKLLKQVISAPPMKRDRPATN